jgi:hypothetical protein
MEAPLPFDLERFKELSLQIAELNAKLGYQYGGSI